MIRFNDTSRYLTPLLLLLASCSLSTLTLAAEDTAAQAAERMTAPVSDTMEASAPDGPAASAPDGMIIVPSAHSVNTTANRLEAVLEEKGMKVFARIDHASNAAKAGKALRPTTLVIFGNPQVGTPFMQCSQSVAIDLPQKMLVWLAKDGQVYAGYNDPAWVAERHLASDCDELVGKIGMALGGFASAATGP